MRNLYTIFSLLLFGSIIFLYLLLSSYNVLNAEDIELSSIPKITGIQEFYWFFYDFVQGRYFTAVLHYFHPLSFNHFDLTWTAPAVALISILFSFCWFLMVVLKEFFNRRFLFVVPICLLAYLFAASPSIPNLFFLTNAIVVYTVSAALMVLVWAIFFKAYYAVNPSIRLWWLAGAAILLFLLGGGGEVFFPVTLLTAFIGAYLFRKHLIGISALLLSTVAGILIAYSSPGNLLDLESARGYEFSIPFLRDFSVKFLNEYIAILFSFFDWKLLLMTFFLAVSSSYLFKENGDHVSGRSFKIGWASLLIALIIPVPVYILCSFIIYERALVPRVVNCCLVLFIIWWSVFSLCLGIYVRQVFKGISVRYLGAITFFLGLATYIVFIRSENVQQAFSDWKSGRAEEHYTEFVERVTRLQNIPQAIRCDTVITIYPYSDWPKSIHQHVDLYGEVASPSWNKAYEAYFGIKKVRALGDKGDNDNLPAYRFKEAKRK